jgi:hypothetical protein
MELTPVPMGTHDGTDEGRVILMRGGVVLEVARLDLVGGRRDRCSSRKSNEGRDDPHVDLMV